MNNIIPFEKSFASHPKSQFLSDKNNINPKFIFKSSGKKYYFNCEKCNHVFNASIANVVKNRWCPYCCIPSRRVCENIDCLFCFSKSFASHAKSQYWSTKNTKLPRQVLKNSNTAFIFDCIDCKHENTINLNNVVSGNWCSYCCIPVQKLCDNIECKLCFNNSFASHNKSSFWSKRNGNITSRNVSKNSTAKYWLFCNTCGHEFERSLSNIKEDIETHCIYCIIPTKLLCDNNDCTYCFSRSFASHEKSIFWSETNTMTPRQLVKYSNKSFIFKCCDCNHEFTASLSNVSKDRWCPYCSNNKLCDYDCIICFEKSFASYDKNIYWSKDNLFTPRQIFAKGDTVVKFNCVCGHVFSCQIKSVTTKNTWCPFCSNSPKQLCEKMDCIQCFNKSFASIDKALYWSRKNILKPRFVFKNANAKYIFDCDKCYREFNKSLNKESWCPYCKNKTEKKLLDSLIIIYPTITTQFKEEWCKRIRHLPFDFCIPEYKIIIELDGIQHFKQVSNWSSPEEQFDNDKYKEKCANDNEYSIIRLLQEDVYYDKYDWFKELCDAVEDIKNGDEIANIYLCKNNEYNDF
jgi:very-short-patch-repair endonuclease